MIAGVFAGYNYLQMEMAMLEMMVVLVVRIASYLFFQSMLVKFALSMVPISGRVSSRRAKTVLQKSTFKLTLNFHEPSLNPSFCSWCTNCGVPNEMSPNKSQDTHFFNGNWQI